MLSQSKCDKESASVRSDEPNSAAVVEQVANNAVITEVAGDSQRISDITMRSIAIPATGLPLTSLSEMQAEVMRNEELGTWKSFTIERENLTVTAAKKDAVIAGCIVRENE